MCGGEGGSHWAIPNICIRPVYHDTGITNCSFYKLAFSSVSLLNVVCEWKSCRGRVIVVLLHERIVLLWDWNFSGWLVCCLVLCVSRNWPRWKHFDKLPTTEMDANDRYCGNRFKIIKWRDYRTETTKYDRAPAGQKVKYCFVAEQHNEWIKIIACITETWIVLVRTSDIRVKIIRINNVWVQTLFTFYVYWTMHHCNSWRTKVVSVLQVEAQLQPATRTLLKPSRAKSPTHNEPRTKRPMW